MPKTFLRRTTIAVAVLLLAAACAPAVQPTAAPTAADPSAASAPTNTAAAAPASSSASSAGSSQQTASSSAYPAPAGETVYTLSADKLEARFKVREQLANRDLPSDAIGKTSSVTGSVAIAADGTIDQANSKFTVDVTNLVSDSSMRDGYVRRAILQTDQFPSATFVPTKVEGLTFPLPSGQVSFKLSGNLTIHGVTKPATWDVIGTITNGVGTGTATTSFTFEDFGLSQPKIPVVLSVVDKITLEVDVTLGASK